LPGFYRGARKRRKMDGPASTGEEGEGAGEAQELDWRGQLELGWMWVEGTLVEGMIQCRRASISTRDPSMALLTR
jgi:hypothetical protein